MATVIVEGIYMGSSLKTSTFDGQSKTSLIVDIYQPESQSNNKAVQLRTDDLSLSNTFNNEYDTGSVIRAEAQVNAYKNNVYFKLIKLKND